MRKGRLHDLIVRDSDAVAAATAAAVTAAALAPLGKLPKMDNDGVKCGPEGRVLLPTGLHEDHELAGHARINAGPKTSYHTAEELDWRHIQVVIWVSTRPKRPKEDTEGIHVYRF